MAVQELIVRRSSRRKDLQGDSPLRPARRRHSIRRSGSRSFSFRGRKELRPFYDLIANIAAEEYGHIEAVGATITTMLTGTDARDVVANGNPAHVLKAGKGVLPV